MFRGHDWWEVMALARLLDSLRWPPPDWIVAIATVALVATGIIQWGALRQQAKTAEKAADAAKESANVLIESERPHVTIQKLNIYRWESSTIDRMVRLSVDFLAANYGRTPVWPKKLQMHTRVHESSQLEDQGGPQYVPESDPLAGILVPRQRMQLLYSEPFLLVMDQDEFHSVMGLTPDKRNLFIYGFIEYQDLHGKSYQSHFGFRYVPAKLSDDIRLRLPGFVFILDRAYWNYT